MKMNGITIQHIPAKQVEIQIQEQLLRLLNEVPILKGVDVFSKSL
ncbi:hypothetical protein GCM10010912_69870 [Paenibacillus albidus]|uniref:Uncharacterized protein n=1 Tax=Paenibacillus albidus TaxID=2041023 RepID=A0A917FZL9_9BACL|nr:hypothetical protein GCM10010912_69870 [Paenibacillus albidus]